MKRILFTIGFIATSSCSVFAQVITFSGDTTGGAGNSGDNYTKAYYQNPNFIAYDQKHNLWITDQGNNMVVMLRTGSGGDNDYYPREGFYSLGGFTDGAGPGNSAFLGPGPIALDKNFNIYILDVYNSAIRKISPYVGIGQSQTTTTLAGGGDPKTTTVGATGYVDAKGTSARFNYPSGMAYSKKQDALFVADANNNVIRKVALDGTVTTYSGSTTPGSTDGAVSKALWDQPVVIYVDSLTDDIYVAETGNSTDGGRLRKITNGVVSTVKVMSNGKSMLAFPSALAMTKMNNNTIMYIANGCTIIQYNMSTGSVTPFAGGDSCGFVNNNNPNKAYFNGITSLLISPDNSYMLAVDQGNNQIRKITLPKTTTGIENFSTVAQSQNIYPNPASSYVMIPAAVSGRSVVSLFDMAGKEVLSTMAIMNTDAPYQLNVSEVPAGIYTVRVAAENTVTTQRLVVTHN